MIELPITATIIMVGIIYLQYQRLTFSAKTGQQERFQAVSEELETKLKEFDEYKKKIDALVIKAGFKL